MMMLFGIAAFLVVPFLGQGNAQDTGIKPCASGCVNGVFLNANSMGCAVDDRLCVCGKTVDFTNGIRDCVNQTCQNEDAADQIPLAQSMGADQCQSASSAAGLLSTPTPASTQPVPPPETTPVTALSTTAAEPTATLASTSGVAPQPTSSANFAAETAAGEPNVSGSTLATMAATESTFASSSTSLAAASKPTGIPSEDTSSANMSDGQDGLTVAARAGIGAGIGAMLVALVLVSFYLFIRRRKRQDAAKQGPAMEISQPLPGSGRQYANNMRQAEETLPKALSKANARPSWPSPRPPPSAQGSQGSQPNSPSAVSYSSELDANTRRYEDMVPRTQPRTMI
ncbi:hypothetical protein GGR54DRAFT_496999 [Hypoxylon sp. NC1633]|nr:hypothetical protein GGR54DRAFT_496999 [Hypoxylon sp. NC1633]